MKRTVLSVLFLIACQAAILTIGALALRVSVSTDVGLVDLIVLLVTGIQLPLLLFMLQRGRGRVVSAALAVCFALLVNVSFISTSAPAAAVTDNSSVFALRNTSTFSPPNLDMVQNYAPGGSTATCGSTGFNWTCAWSSDTFTAGQSLTAGNAQADLFVSNNPVPTLRFSSNLVGGGNTVCTLNKPASLANGDVMLAACSFRGGTGTTITSVPAGWSLVGSRVDSTTTVGLVVYVHVVTDASTEPASYSWNFSASVKYSRSLVVYTGIDGANPIDDTNSQPTASGTSHATPSITTTVTNDMVISYHVTGTCTAWTPPAGMTERSDDTFCSQSASSNVDMETNEMLVSGAGATGALTATDDAAAVGVTAAVALKRDTAPKTCSLTAQLMKPVGYRATDSSIAADATTIVINKPAGVINGDVMVATVGAHWTTGLTITAPAGWTLVGSGNNGACCTLNVYTKVASSEPANYTWTSSAATTIAGGISAYWNVDTVTVYDVQAGNASGGASETTPVITTTQPAELLVASFMGSSNGSWTPPSGMAERFDRAAVGTFIATVEQADVTQTLAGAISKTATVSPATGSGATHIVALKSANGSGYLGSTTVPITSPATTTLVSRSIAIPAVTFVTGDRLQLDVVSPNDQVNCFASVSFDSSTAPSQLTLATSVPEGVAGLMLLAPALPLVCRWRRRR